MITFQVSQSPENLTSHAGLALIEAALNRTELAQRLNEFERPKAKQEPDISHSEVIYSYIGRLGLGQSDYEALEPLREDEWGFKVPLALETVPSVTVHPPPRIMSFLHALSGNLGMLPVDSR